MNRRHIPNPEFENLVEQRDQLAIELSLLKDASTPNWNTIETFARRLSILENEIAKHKRY